MSEKIEIQKIYNPSEAEDEIYKKWEESGYFNPDNLDLPLDALTYTIILPPPNITDKLHLGHSAMLAIEDLLIRYHRMKGYRALWIPGTDHAAIATQNVVEKKLLKEEGLTRHDLGREKFLERVWEFLRETQATILRQTRKMGASLDWSRTAFTLDEPRVEAVQKMFIDMYNAGVIYRGERIVNWCPRCHSTLADDEVEYKAQKAKLYTFKYSKDFPFSISTTRPETKLGDTAVAVNPKDKRYEKYIGKTYDVDFCGIKLKLKIIADRHVEMDFGTGALGVTPAHSMADWQMAQENGLKIIKVIGEDGTIEKLFFSEYSGKTVEEARKMIVEKLKENDLLEKEEEIENNLSVCYRCGTPVEPLPSRQWFVAVDKKIEKLGNKSLKERAVEVAKSGEIKFIPDRFEKIYLNWMENLRDWCISRQIWFGHRIPVWYKVAPLIRGVGGFDGEQENQKIEKLRNKEIENEEEIYVGDEPPQGDGWVQDPDSLDTWFSSGMWTFSTLGWPKTFKDGRKSGDLAKFHPTQVLETGYEILTLWVSRMIMMSLFAVGEIPFSNVYLHGMILDKHGKKMSKSKGNGIDPIDMIDKFGTDAVRLSLLMGSTPGNDARLSEEKIAGFRNFTNKLWNISRYIISNFKFQISNQIQIPNDKILNKDYLTLADRWILERLDSVVESVTNDIENYKFSQAGEILKDFTWNDFADWYIEISKFEGAAKTPQSPAGDCGGAGSDGAESDGSRSDGAESDGSRSDGAESDGSRSKDAVLNFVLQNLLKLWHPFMPFVTESIWGMIGNEKMLMVEKWPVQENKKTRKHINDKTKKQENQKTPLGAMSFDWNSLNMVPKIDTYNQGSSSKNFVKSFSKKQENNKVEGDFNLIKNIITAIRNARSENNIEPSKKIKAVICAGANKELVESQSHLIKNLKTGIGELEVKNYFAKEEATLPLTPSAGGGNSKSSQPSFAKGGDMKSFPDTFAGGGKSENAIYTTVNGFDIYLIGAVDFEKEKERITDEIEGVKKYVKQIEGKLSNQEFVNNAPEAVVQKEKKKLAAQKERLEKLEGSLGSLTN